MKKIIRDPQGRKLVLDECVGTGSFGSVWRARPEDGGSDVFATKLPISADDLTSDVSTELLSLAHRMVRTQGVWLKALPSHLAPRVYGIVDGGGAIPCLVMDYLPGNLQEVLARDLHFVDLVDTLAALSRALVPLHEAGRVHGNLKPGNVFIVGPDDYRFTDTVGETGRLLRDSLAMLPGWQHRVTPELLANPDDDTLLTNPVLDTFAVGKIFYQAVVAPHAVGDVRATDGLFVGAIDKEHLERFQQALLERYTQDEGNPHTRDLFLRRAAALIQRALSSEMSPSPPYRFYSAAELASRFEELHNLFHPSFEQLGPIVLDRPAANPAFYHGEDVKFTLSFRCQGGITNPDLLNCFVYVRDMEKQQKVRDLVQEVLPLHDGSRFRCAFTLRGLMPGQYLLRVGLGIRGTPGKPIPRDEVVTVRERPAGVVFPTPEPLSPRTPVDEPLLDDLPELPPEPPAAPAPRSSGENPVVPRKVEEVPTSASGRPTSTLFPEGRKSPPAQAEPPAPPRPEPGVAPAKPPRPEVVARPRPNPTVRPTSERPPRDSEVPAAEAPSNQEEDFHPELYYRQARGGLTSTQDLIAQGSGMPPRSTLLIVGILFVVAVLIFTWIMWMGGKGGG